jgi:hypothetical protein
MDLATIGLFLGALLLLLLASLAFSLSHLMALRSAARSIWAETIALFDHRAETAVVLAEAVRPYATGEEPVLLSLARERSLAASATDTHVRMAAERGLALAIQSFLAWTNRYPEIDAGGRLTQLRAELSTTEALLAERVHAFNAVASVHNRALERRPTSLIAWALHLRPIRTLEVPDTAGRTPPEPESERWARQTSRGGQ